MHWHLQGMFYHNHEPEILMEARKREQEIKRYVTWLTRPPGQTHSKPKVWTPQPCLVSHIYLNFVAMPLFSAAAWKPWLWPTLHEYILQCPNGHIREQKSLGKNKNVSNYLMRPIFYSVSGYTNNRSGPTKLNQGNVFQTAGGDPRSRTYLVGSWTV